MFTHTDEHDQLTCSFCSKHQTQVKRLIAGPKGVYICDECVALCSEIVDEELNEDSSPAVPQLERKAPIKYVWVVLKPHMQAMLERHGYLMADGESDPTSLRSIAFRGSAADTRVHSNGMISTRAVISGGSDPGSEHRDALHGIELAIQAGDVEYVFETYADEIFQWPDVVFCPQMGEGAQKLLDDASQT